MTNAEKNALKKAFDIPEPQKKRQFIAEYKELSKGRKTRLVPPLFIKIASTAAACALVCGLWLNVKKNTNIKPDNSDLVGTIIVTTEQSNGNTDSDDIITTDESVGAAVSVETVTDTAVKTAKNGKKSTTANKTTVTTSKAQNGTNTAAGNNVSSEHTSDTPGTVQDKPDTSSSQQDKPKTSTTKQNSPRTTSSSTTNKPVRTTTTKASDPTPVPPVDDPEYPEEPVTPATPTTRGSDKTLTPSVTYNKDHVISIAELDPNSSKGTAGGVGPSDNNAGGGSGGANGVAPAVDPLLSELASGSDHIIRGRVDEIIYTSENGRAFTQLNIIVTDVLRQDDSIVSGDKISVRYIGGYISAREFAQKMGWDVNVPDDLVVYEESENTYTPFEGEEYVMFIRDGGYEVPSGGYSFTRQTDKSIFRDHGDYYTTLDDRNYYSSYDFSYMI